MTTGTNVHKPVKAARTGERIVNVGYEITCSCGHVSTGRSARGDLARAWRVTLAKAEEHMDVSCTGLTWFEMLGELMQPI